MKLVLKIICACIIISAPLNGMDSKKKKETTSPSKAITVDVSSIHKELVSAVTSEETDRVQSIITALDNVELLGVKVKKRVLNSPRVTMNMKMSPLLIAAAGGCLPMLQLLEKNGANIYARAKSLSGKAPQNALQLASSQLEWITGLGLNQAYYRGKNPRESFGETIAYLKPILEPVPTSASASSTIATTPSALAKK